jgi:tetratricopeptide (TPR) repeat protein
MKVAFHLRRRPSPEPASAVLLETDRVEALLDLASRLGLDRLPPIHRVAGGFLLKLGEGVQPPVGPIRLRSLAENLYLPVDADLVPALLDDEAKGVTRDRGLIFLPGGRVLGFEPRVPLSLSSLVTADRREGTGWRSFPDRPVRAERIHEITLEAPEGSTNEDVFEAGGDAAEIGSDGPPRPEDAGAASTLAGRAAVGAGKGLIGLGAMLGIKALADLGAKWINRAVERVPRLTEAMLGKQEGSLRELLRQFREGDIERALRHALPLGGNGNRGGTPSVDGKLPTVDPTYSLQSLLGSNRGPTGIWFGGFDVQAELAKEYRKAAEDAERHGDYRRAAYIHGKLLGDFATAAHLLCKGGLYRDAAYLYLNRLKDLPAAARAFESAGEVDRALQLYRQDRLHAEAGDLLRRVGEEEGAIAEYVCAADLLIADPKHGSIAAGDLLRDRAYRPDLALPYYAAGWMGRPSTNAVPCALRMASIFADRGEVENLVTLVDQADALLKGPGREAPAIEFYNELALMAERDALAEVRDDLRDRSLMGLAYKLRQRVATDRRPGLLNSNYLGRSRAWAPDLVSDANHALRSAFDQEAERLRLSRMVLGPSYRGEPRRIEVEGGVVSSVCQASSTGELFLGFEGGRVYSFDAVSGIVRWVTEEPVPISSMAVDPEGRTLMLMLGEGPGPRRLVHLDRTHSAASGWARQARMIDGPGDFWLTPVMTDGSVRALAIWNGEEMILMGGIGDLSLWVRLPMPFLKTDPPAAILIPPADGKPPTPRAVLIHDGSDLCQVESMGKSVRRRDLGWRPTLPEGHTLRSAPLAWLQVDPERFELAGLDSKGVIHWSSLKVNDAEFIRTSFNDSKGETVYAATTLVRAGLVAGVTSGRPGVSPSRVDWLRCGTQTFAQAGSIGLVAVGPMACFPAHRTDELIVVCKDGTLVCVPTTR